MTDRPPMPQETVATRAAFRAGVKGLRYTEHPDPGFDIPVATDNTPGPNERHFETIERVPGLSDPEAAYGAGRALRMIGHILDSQHSPIEHGQHFLSQLGNAVLFFGLRGERKPWGAEDTAFVFRDTFKPSRPRPPTPRGRTMRSWATRASGLLSKRDSASASDGRAPPQPQRQGTWPEQEVQDPSSIRYRGLG